MLTTDLNWAAVVVAAAANVIIGALWYSPPAFGRRWMDLIGRSQQDLSAAGPLYALTALAALVEAIALSWFISQTGWRTGSGGALIGLYAGLGFTATAMFSEVLFAGRPARLYAINAGYQVFQAVVMGAIIGFLGSM